MANLKTRFIITEQFAGTITPTEIFTNLILSEMREKVWNLEQQSVIIESSTIPDYVVPKERSSNGT